MNIIKAALTALRAVARRARALATGSGAPARAAGTRIKAALYDGYVGAYAEFYRNEYSLEASRRC